MQANKSSGTLPEMAVRRGLWAAGLRFRVNVHGVVGCPDIAFGSRKVAVFVDGDFWHGYRFDDHERDFKSSVDFWVPKIRANMKRDADVNDRLAVQGWLVLRFWEHEVDRDLQAVLASIAQALADRPPIPRRSAGLRRE